MNDYKNYSNIGLEGIINISKWGNGHDSSSLGIILDFESTGMWDIEIMEGMSPVLGIENEPDTKIIKGSTFLKIKMNGDLEIESFKNFLEDCLQKLEAFKIKEKK